MNVRQEKPVKTRIFINIIEMPPEHLHLSEEDLNCAPDLIACLSR